MNYNKIANVYILLVIIILVYLAGIAYLNLEAEAQDQACKKIGFESYERNSGQDYCEDENYNLHYVKIIPVGFLVRYKAVKISIGDARINNLNYYNKEE